VNVSDVEEEKLTEKQEKEVDELDAQVELARDYLPAEPEDLKDFHKSMWQFNVSPVLSKDQLTGKQGAQHTLPPDSAKPYDYFCLYIPEFFYNKWAGFTNMRADAVYAERDGKVRHWRATSAAELKAFFASVIWHSLLSNATILQHLKKEFGQSKLSYWFSSDTRWEQIKRFLKLSDPSTDKDHSDDRMHRIRELFEYFMTASKANYQPGESIALDEAMKKFKGRCKFKQYIKNKPIRWGLKIYCVACSETSYLCNAEFYLGKNLEDGKEGVSVLQQTCLRLLRPFANHNRIVHIDNFIPPFLCCSP
jgi:Transposase IS4